MADYRVIKDFRDKNHAITYYQGDYYPAEGYNANATRLRSLSTMKKHGGPFIEEIPDEYDEDVR